MNDRYADVCFSPLLYDRYIRENTTVVMVDAIRASAVMVTALMNGASEIIPHSEIEPVAALGEEGCLTAGERNGIALPEFNFGNSPLEFTESAVKGHKIAMTTTNGTRALNTAAGHALAANRIVVGSFLNISALARFLEARDDNLLILCSGWKDGVNIEDSFFAGKLLSKLSADAFIFCEAANMALRYVAGFAENSYDEIMRLSPRLLAKQDRLEADVRYCLQEDLSVLIPEYRDGILCPLKMS